MILIFPNIEVKYPANKQISTDVNSVLANDVQLTPVTSGPMKGWSKFTVTGDHAEAGGMPYFELGFPNYPRDSITTSAFRPRSIPTWRSGKQTWLP